MPKPTDDTESFLGRWSRNKRAQPVEQDDIEELEHSLEPEAEKLLSDEDIAALPALDDLTPQSDIRVFLQKGVPQALRNAALRRKWMLVPGIRDHKDPAVDYAWDWNTPGGVPGDGVAPSPERAAQMLRELFAPRRDAEVNPNLETEAERDGVVPEPSADDATQQATPAADQHEIARSVINPEAEAASESKQRELPQAALELPLARRRHGGASPE